MYHHTKSETIMSKNFKRARNFVWKKKKISNCDVCSSRTSCSDFVFVNVNGFRVLSTLCLWCYKTTSQLDIYSNNGILTLEGHMVVRIYPSLIDYTTINDRILENVSIFLNHQTEFINKALNQNAWHELYFHMNELTKSKESRLSILPRDLIDEIFSHLKNW